MTPGALNAAGIAAYLGVTPSHADALTALRVMEAESVQCIVTSPPYWQQRQYGTEPLVFDGREGCEHVWDVSERRHVQGATNPNPSGTLTGGREKYATTATTATCSLCNAWRGELGQEPTVQLYIAHLVQIFEECRRVLHRSGTMFLNIGDTRVNGSKWGGHSGCKNEHSGKGAAPRAKIVSAGEKSMALIPERLLIALQDAGWIIRSKIIWEKPSAMPESATDRPTESWEPIYFLTKSPKYKSFFDQIREPAVSAATPSVNGWVYGEGGHGSRYRKGEDGGKPALPDTYKGSLPGRKDGPGQDRRSAKDRGKNGGSNLRTRETLNQNWDAKEAAGELPPTRNIRNVWRFPSKGTNFQHYACFPEELPIRCILAGSAPGDTVLDPFAGTGTTGAVAIRLGRKAILIEPQADYLKMIEKRLAAETPSLLEATP